MSNLPDIKLLTRAMNKIESDLSDSKIFENDTFSEIHLAQNTRLTEVEFHNCTFINCKFFKVIFFNCRFENCIFQNCDLSSILIKHSVFDGVLFEESKTTGIQWADAGIPLDVKFRQCSLNYCSFIGVDLRGTEMTHCTLKEADFSETNLSKSNCQYSDFTGARFANTNLEYTDFSYALNYSIHPDGNKLKKTVFSSPDVLSLLDVYDIVIK
ncbi:MAG: pentapeptide repeat-containing protein [Pseudomonadota bacterium]